ncbi:hypothetical protein GCM10007047_18020 [Cerasicoccus arenae]|uniref:Uncharacterized protein n=1 Tax=Cerasicoccus arenae TaxID=424488 RepID=A0A8J3DC64_9BACT|nr:hypothetical protein GCM10007047_18020 [Cerasicoccus arenae]
MRNAKPTRRHFEPVDMEAFAGIRGWIAQGNGSVSEIREDGTTVAAAVDLAFLEGMKRRKVIRETRQNWNAKPKVAR